ncbi:TonB-dependent receptor [Roseomonas sp. BN140053]|uniref:TonB-dependent receptor n=1 Tax=Roseomonas sp. BN140053 TaxID=3391898 RepID=UPI0039E926EE
MSLAPPRHANLLPTIGLAGAGFLSALALPAAAQAPTDETVALPEVSVQGQAPAPYRPDLRQNAPRSPVPIAETPQTINVVPQEVIQQRNATTVREALRNVTGISLAAGEGGFSGDNLTLRGFSARGDFFIDGIRDLGQYTRDTFFLENVEVLKGPSAVQFGRGSTGGAINQTSRLPLAQTTGTLSISGYNPGGVRSVGDVNIRAGDVAARLVAMGSSIDAADRGPVRQQRWGVAPSITLGMEGPTQFTLAWVHQEENNIPDFGVPYIDGRPARVPRSTYYGLRDLDRERTLTDVVTARLTHQFDNGIRLTNTSRYGGYYRDLSATAPRILATTPAVTGTTPLERVQVRREPQVREGYDSLLVNQTEVTANVRTGFVQHAILAGFEIARESSELTRFTQTGRPNSPLLNPDDWASGRYTTTPNSDVKTVANTYSFYAIDQARLGQYFEVLLGARWDSFDADYRNRTIPRPTGQTQFSRTDEKFTWRGSLIFKPTESLRTYFSYGTSFNPSAESLTLAANNAQLAPETARSYEIGAQWELLDGVRLNTALFRTVKTNARTSDLTNQTLQVLDGDVRVQGIEVSITGRILPGWNVLAGYTYLDSEIRSSGNRAEIGKEFANVAPHTATLWTTYDLPPIAGVTGVQIGGGVQHISRRFGNTTNTVRAPSFTRYDAALAWEPTDGPLQGLRFQANAINLGNTRAFETVYTGHVVESPGRTFVLSTSARF